MEHNAGTSCDVKYVDQNAFLMSWFIKFFVCTGSVEIIYDSHLYVALLKTNRNIAWFYLLLLSLYKTLQTIYQPAKGRIDVKSISGIFLFLQLSFRLYFHEFSEKEIDIA